MPRGDPLDILSNVLDIQTGGKGLTELVSLLSVVEDQGVKVAGAPDLELGLGAVLLDAGRGSILSAGNLEEVLDVLDLLGLRKGRGLNRV